MPATLQLLHRPLAASSLQAVSQHTPSLQWPLTHWPLAVQAVPKDFKPQELPTQVLGGTQSASEAQLALHAPPLHTKVPQLRLSGVMQAPAPSQADAGVWDELEAQAAGLQLLPLSKNAQTPPLQAPVVPQVAGALTLHLPWGSGAPSLTVVHRPSEPAKLQALQASEQDWLQHTPWAHVPDRHSPPALHAAPLGFRPHDEFSQNCPGTHCLSLAQVEKQLLPLHRKGLHEIERGDTHCPTALHREGGVYEPATQLSGAQIWPGGYFWQEPLPSHSPFRPQLVALSSLHCPRGSSDPLATLRQRPGDPGRAQLRQGPEHSLSQQTPSTHCPETHSSASLQDWPFCFFPQDSFPLASFAQAMPGAQSLSDEQDGLQAPLLQA